MGFVPTFVGTLQQLALLERYLLMSTAYNSFQASDVQMGNYYDDYIHPQPHNMKHIINDLLRGIRQDRWRNRCCVSFRKIASNKPGRNTTNSVMFCKCFRVVCYNKV